MQGELILAPLFVKMSGWQIHCQKSFKNTLWRTFPSFRVGEYFVRGSVASARPLHTNILTYKPFLHNVLEHPSSSHLHFYHAKCIWSLKKELRITGGWTIWHAFSHAKCILMLQSTMFEEFVCMGVKSCALCCYVRNVCMYGCWCVAPGQPLAPGQTLFWDPKGSITTKMTPAAPRARFL